MMGLKRLTCIFMLLVISGCSNLQQQNCAQVASYLVPDSKQSLYPVMILAIDSKPVLPQAFYQLTVGNHSVQVTEFISNPKLDVDLKYRIPKTIQVSAEAGYRYHIAAKYNGVTKAFNTDYWQPEVWKKQEVLCEQQGQDNK